MNEEYKEMLSKIIGTLIIIVVSLLLILVGSLIGLLILRTFGTMFTLLF